MRVLFLCPYPYDASPSQRFRFEQYFNLLTQQNIEYVQCPFFSVKTWDILYKRGSFIQKLIGVVFGFVNRYSLVLRANKFDYIFVHRESEPLGPPIVFWYLAKVLKKKIIFDFDDAIWLKNHSHSNRFFAFFKRYRNVNFYIKYAHKVVAGNSFLADYARKYNDNVIVVPTTLDLENVHNKKRLKNSTIPVIGWTGSHSTLHYLDMILPVLKKLSAEKDFKLRVISDDRPNFDCSFLEFVKWNKTTEIEDLVQFDIGIMPLVDEYWAKGKCGFKALQYMALEIPAVVSPVGVNNEIIQDGVNGFHCETPEAWLNKLRDLLDENPVNSEIAEKGYETVVNHYSVKANAANFILLFAE